MKEIVKTCKIHGELTIEQVDRRSDTGGFKCSECRRNYLRPRNRELRRNNSEQINEKIRADRKANPEKYREWEKRQYYKNVEKSRYMDVLNKHKISADSYKNMFEKQKGLCAICRNKETRLGRNGKDVTRLAIDHNHDTGKIRALLCHSCNTGIGKFKENKELLKAAIEYLDLHEDI